jgi:hypothetical protein
MNRTEEWNSYFGNKPPPRGCVHVIVVVPAVEKEAKKPRTCTEDDDAKPRSETSIVFDSNTITNIASITTGTFYDVSGLDIAGLVQVGSDDATKRFYCREKTQVILLLR